MFSRVKVRLWSLETMAYLHFKPMRHHKNLKLGQEGKNDFYSEMPYKTPASTIYPHLSPDLRFLLSSSPRNQTEDLFLDHVGCLTHMQKYSPTPDSFSHIYFVTINCTFSCYKLKTGIIPNIRIYPHMSHTSSLHDLCYTLLDSVPSLLFSTSS